MEALDAFDGFRFSPEASARLVKVFGTDQPLSLKRVATSASRYTYEMTIRDFDYTSADGSVLSWAPMSGTIHTDPAGRRYQFTMAWPQMKVEDKTMAVLVSDVSASAQMKRGAEDLWFGEMRFGVKSISGSGAASFAALDTSGKFNIVERGKLVDAQYALTTRSFEFNGEAVGAFELAGRVVGIPAKVMAALNDAQERMGAITDPVAKRTEVLREFRRLGPALAASGGAIHIDHLGITYQGHTASLQGQLAFSPMRNAESASRADIMKQLSGTFTLRIPVAMIEAVARTVTRAQMKKAKPDQPVDDEALAKATGNARDLLIGKAVNSGYASLDNGFLVSRIELRDGKLSANGKAVTLPKRTPKPQAAPSEQAPPPRGVASAARIAR